MKKTILYIDTCPTFGGAPISLYTLLKGINKQAIVPVVVTNSVNKNDYFYLNEKIPGVTYERLEVKSPWTHDKVCSFFSRFCKPVAIMFKLGYWITVGNLVDAYKYYRLGKKYKIDAIHANSSFGPTMAIPYAAKMLGVPLIVHERGVGIYPYGDHLFKSAQRYATHHIAVSKYIKNDVMTVMGIPDDKVSVVLNGADEELFNLSLGAVQQVKRELGIADGTFVVSIVGRLAKWKGIDVFLKAAAEVLKTNTNVVFLVPGDGPEEDSLKQIATSLDIENKVRFLGFRKDQYVLMKASDVVINSSIEPEPCGRSIIESMGVGVPVIASDCGGTPEVIREGENGYLFPVGDYSVLALLIQRLIDDPFLLTHMKIVSQAYYKRNLTSERYVRNVQSVYQMLGM